ncbi:hypothetical protein NQ318_015906 [Aromia moschata]|uniref:C2 NT-type domain-containing protein n=1 Tax=Aromia moschata TaxID=1265417 RepID=A0AAV8Y8T1_9CUCU|nr:hypothetical protein NQ318_015906 [Aromia moschata]
MAKTQAIARKAQIDLNNADHRQQLLNLKDLLRQKAKAKGARLHGRINHTQLKKEFQEKYKSRVTKLLNTFLSGGNLIKAINSWAVPVLTYSFGIVKWSVTDLDELDRLTRRLLTKFRHLHTNSSVIRLYLPRRRGGRGLLNIKNHCLNQEASLRRKLLTNRDPLITAVAREDAGYTPLSLGCELIPVDYSVPRQPHKLSLVWSRRSRRVTSAPMVWEPTLQNPYKGLVVWPVPENHQVAITLFKDPRTNELEDKDWSFILEDVLGSPHVTKWKAYWEKYLENRYAYISLRDFCCTVRGVSRGRCWFCSVSHVPTTGKRRQLATAHVNMRKYASVESTQTELQINFKPTSKKITAAKLDCTLSCVFLREGKATDEDMQSMASLMSVNNNTDDIAPLEDVEDEEYSFSDNVMKNSLSEVTQNLQLMTNSLSGSDFASTPISENLE